MAGPIQIIFTYLNFFFFCLKLTSSYFLFATKYSSILFFLVHISISISVGRMCSKCFSSFLSPL